MSATSFAIKGWVDYENPRGVMVVLHADGLPGGGEVHVEVHRPKNGDEWHAAIVSFILAIKAQVNCNAVMEALTEPFRAQYPQLLKDVGARQ